MSCRSSWTVRHGHDSMAHHARSSSSDPLSGTPPMVFYVSVPQSAGMDDITSRTRPTSRRMASAKASGTTKRSSSGRGARSSQQPEVSPARWAGVALVIAAIVGAIALAMISPSEQGEPQQPGVIAEAPSPSFSSTPGDGQVPTVQPTITSPGDRTETPEVEIAVAVELPPMMPYPGSCSGSTSTTPTRSTSSRSPRPVRP